MLVWSWLLAGEHVEGSGNRAGVEGDENPSIFHDCKLGVPSERIPGYIRDGQPGQDEPDDKSDIDHATPPALARAPLRETPRKQCRATLEPRRSRIPICRRTGRIDT